MFDQINFIRKKKSAYYIFHENSDLKPQDFVEHWNIKSPAAKIPFWFFWLKNGFQLIDFGVQQVDLGELVTKRWHCRAFQSSSAWVDIKSES